MPFEVKQAPGQPFDINFGPFSISEDNPQRFEYAGGKRYFLFAFECESQYLY